ncbi:galactose mutarotase-like domain-containing protein [Coprinopsis sp. MPI-PUGE-AT-0042]|nr:galactose mutarotase-like domain-containing protein [Coprinopsis sp. MPI-PUGE-AT-0042]
MSEFQPVQVKNGPITLEVLPYGVTIHRFLADVNGKTHDLVIGPEKPEDHKTQKYTNSIVGRYANRIPVGTHKLERKGFESSFDAQANENPRVSLHGGPVAWDAVPWTNVTSNPTLFTKAEISALGELPPNSFTVFQLVSADGDQGYPGKLVAETLVAVVAGGDSAIGSVVIVYRAKLDEGDKKVVTPVNLTQHWGFNLNASLDSHPISVKDDTLVLQAGHMVVRDADSLSKGYTDITQDPVHSHSGKTIGEHYPEAGYDDYYLLRPGVPAADPTRIPSTSFTPELNLIKSLLERASATHPAAAADLSSKSSGLRITFDSNQQGLMVYTNGLSSVKKGARKVAHGGSGISGNGDSYGPGDAVFLEFHDPLAAFLDPKNKDGEDTLVTSNEIYHNFVKCNVFFKA